MMKLKLCVGKTALLVLLSLALLCALAATTAAQKPDPNLSHAVERSEKSAAILERILDTSGGHIPEELLRRAEAVAIFPEVSRLNLLIEHLMIGYGVLSHRTPGGWSLPAYYAFKGGKLGPNKVGTESPSIIMLFLTEKAFGWIAKGQIRMKGEKKAVGGQVVTGPGPQEAEPVDADIVVYTYSGGQLTGKAYEDNVMLGGYRVYPDNNMNKWVYRKKAVEVLNLERLDARNLPQGVISFQEKLKALAQK